MTLSQWIPWLLKNNADLFILHLEHTQAHNELCKIDFILFGKALFPKTTQLFIIVICFIFRHHYKIVAYLQDWYVLAKT